MSDLSSKKVQDIYALYEGMYQKEETLTEEQYDELLAIEWYNALVEAGIIDGEMITENAAANPGMWTKIGDAISKGGPRVMNFLRKTTGFGLGAGTGGKRRALTVGGATAAAIDPQKAAQQVGGAVTGTANVLQGAARGGWDAATKKKEEAANNPKAYIDPATGTIKFTK